MKNWLDLYVVIGYLLCTFTIGIFASKILHRNRKTTDDFFLAGRNMKGWITGLSFSLAAVNADVAPLYVDMGAALGLSVCWFYLSRFTISWLIIATLFAVKWRQIGIATGPEFFSLRFKGNGGKFVRVYSSMYALLMGMIPWIGTGLLGLHMIAGPIFGIENKIITISIVVPVILAYVWISGFAGILVVDVFLGVVIVLANFALLLIVLFHFGGPTGIFEAITKVHGTFANNIMNPLPQPNDAILSPLVIGAFLILATFGMGGNVGPEGQRIISCRDNKEAAKMAVWAEIALFGILLTLTLPSLGAIINHPELYHAAPAKRELAYGLLMADFLPKGLLGLALAAMIASVMSSVSSHLNYGSQTLVNDVYGTLVGKPKEAHAVWLGRFFMLLIIGVAFLVVYFSKSLMGIVVFLTGLGGSVALINWAQWWWWRINFKSWLTANITGPIVYFSLSWILGRCDWWQQQATQVESVRQQMQIYQAIISMFITTCAWVTVTLLTKPEDMELLKNFYRKAHPPGLWKPVRLAIAAEDGTIPKTPRMLIPAGFMVAVIGAIWLSCTVICLSYIFVAKWKSAGLYGGIGIIFAVVFKYAFGWHIERMARASSFSQINTKKCEVLSNL
ncbi:MAG: sodium:solute symporter [Phycisphaerales bacterium]